MSEATTMTESEALRGLPKGSKGIDLTKKETVYATETAPFHEEGEPMTAHPNLTKEWVKRGYATTKK